MPEIKDKVGMLQTPVLGVKKNKKLVRWYYSLHDDAKLQSGEITKYYKGLGSHKKEDLEMIIKKDGISSMIDMIDWDDESEVKNWLSNDAVQTRKDNVTNNNFDIAKL